MIVSHVLSGCKVSIVHLPTQITWCPLRADNLTAPEAYDTKFCKQFINGLFCDQDEQTYQESGNEGDDGTVCCQSIGNSTHSVFTDTIPDVCARVCSKTSVRWLEVDRFLNLGQVTARQIRRSTNKIWQAGDDGSEDNFGQFTGSLSSIGGLVHWECLLPSFWELARDTAGQFGVLVGVLLAV